MKEKKSVVEYVKSREQARNCSRGDIKKTKLVKRKIDECVHLRTFLSIYLPNEIPQRKLRLNTLLFFTFQT